MWQETLKTLGIDPDTPDEDLAQYTMPCRYTREGNVVTIHTQAPDNDVPMINWFGWDQEVFDEWRKNV